MSEPVDVQIRLPHETFKVLAEIADLRGTQRANRESGEAHD